MSRFKKGFVVIGILAAAFGILFCLIAFVAAAVIASEVFLPGGFVMLMFLGLLVELIGVILWIVLLGRRRKDGGAFGLLLTLELLDLMQFGVTLAICLSADQTPVTLIIANTIRLAVMILLMVDCKAELRMSGALRMLLFGGGIAVAIVLPFAGLRSDFSGLIWDLMMGGDAMRLVPLVLTSVSAVIELPLYLTQVMAALAVATCRGKAAPRAAEPPRQPRLEPQPPQYQPPRQQYQQYRQPQYQAPQYQYPQQPQQPRQQYQAPQYQYPQQPQRPTQDWPKGGYWVPPREKPEQTPPQE